MKRWLAIALACFPCPLLAGGPIFAPAPISPVVLAGPVAASPAQANQTAMSQVIAQLNRQQIQLAIAAAQTSPILYQPVVFPKQVVVKPKK